MPENNPNQNIKKLGKEHMQNIFKAAMGGIPIIGGPINSLLSDYLPDYKYNRMMKFIEELSKDISEKINTIDEDYIKSEEFGYLFEKTLKSVSQEYRNEKLIIYKNLIINFCIKQDIESEEKEYILAIINNLEYLHIIVFSFFIDPQKFIDENNIRINTNGGLGTSLSNTLVPVFRQAGLDELLWKSTLLDLENKGIIKEVYKNLNVMMSSCNNDTFKNSVTPLGNKIKNLIIL